MALRRNTIGNTSVEHVEWPLSELEGWMFVSFGTLQQADTCRYQNFKQQMKPWSVPSSTQVVILDTLCRKLLRSEENT
ncbi:hypothetical protein SAMN05216420_11374 [Nitrosospira sp. Nl5]|nr:hypothetical protein SAMN05216420_11374 [Nitrosospira sp. Nl5]